MNKPKLIPYSSSPKRTPVRFKEWKLPSNYKMKFDPEWRQIAAVNKLPKRRRLPKRITIKLTRQLAELLFHRLERGLYGRTIEEVAERLLCEAVR